MIYAYRRVSTATQVEKGEGLSAQRTDIIKFAKKEYSVTIDKDNIFTDEGVSGTSLDRKGLSEMLAVVKPGDIIIVQKTSRLWRNELTAGFLKKRFLELGIIVRVVENPSYDIHTTDPTSNFMNQILQAIDEFERLTINTRLARGRKEKSANGSKSSGNAPAGYKWDNTNIVVDEEEKQTVQLIYKLYLEKKSLRKVEQELANRGLKSRRGNNYSSKTIHVILTNDFYKGIVTHASEKSQGTHEAIINKITWGKVNALLSKK